MGTDPQQTIRHAYIEILKNLGLKERKVTKRMDD
jgi:hypothetical protein